MRPDHSQGEGPSAPKLGIGGAQLLRVSCVDTGNVLAQVAAPQRTESLVIRKGVSRTDQKQASAPLSATQQGFCEA